MTCQDLRPLRRASDRRRAKRMLHRIAVRTSYTMSALCFIAAAVACGESNHPLWLIMTIVAACMGGMVGFYWLAAGMEA